jgi:hypothetical protein
VTDTTHASHCQSAQKGDEEKGASKDVLFLRAFVPADLPASRTFDFIPASSTHRREHRDEYCDCPISFYSHGCFHHALSSRDESVFPRASFSCSTEHRKKSSAVPAGHPFYASILWREIMPKQLVVRAIESPAWLVAVCFALWFAAHSFFAFLFISFAVAAWIMRSMKVSLKEDRVDEPKAPSTDMSSPTPAEAMVKPIKREYAKSAVVIPLKTGADD